MNLAQPPTESLPPTESFEAVILALLTAMEARDIKLRRHAERVARFSAQLGDQLALSKNERRLLHCGALLHDIGNIGIPDSILLKPSGLTQWEFEEMKLHPIIGEQICKPLVSTREIRPFLRSHHERLDGTGYPDSLIGDEIPRLVRLLAVVDVYDSMRSERAYRSALSHDEAIATLYEEVESGWWEPEYVDLLTGITAPDADFAPV